jgi:hypothetical protein
MDYLLFEPRKQRTASITLLAQMFMPKTCYHRQSIFSRGSLPDAPNRSNLLTRQYRPGKPCDRHGESADHLKRLSFPLTRATHRGAALVDNRKNKALRLPSG